MGCRAGEYIRRTPDGARTVWEPRRAQLLAWAAEEPPLLPLISATFPFRWDAPRIASQPPQNVTSRPPHLASPRSERGVRGCMRSLLERGVTGRACVVMDGATDSARL